MSSAAALLRERSLILSDGPYEERGEPLEPDIEHTLRSIWAKLPRHVASRRRLKRFVATVNRHEDSLRKLTDEELTAALRSPAIRLRTNGFRDEPMALAFAIVREAAKRVLGMRHHDVQLIGGWALLNGVVAEMETGEGKTLVATLAACTAAAAGAATHVVTVNDYLAERDAANNRPLFAYFGLSVGNIVQGMTPEQRRTEYTADVVYVSNKELVFDYLKDRIAIRSTSAAHVKLRALYRPAPERSLLLRGLHVAIVDEADSVLTDEARTPLIISQSEPDSDQALFDMAIEVGRELRQGVHFELSPHNEVNLTAEGERFLDSRVADLQGVWQSAVWRDELISKALAALWCYQRDQHYIVAENKIQIVDEFTGRIMPDRSWEHGLHQMIEAKENCERTSRRRTLSRITYQRFFRRYLLLGGMTGTAREVESELRRVYELNTLRIPTHRPSRRRRLADRCWSLSGDRWCAIADRAVEISRAGRAVLIGTRSVEASEQLSLLLTERGAEHRVLNARQDKAEADIVAHAGESGCITVATNMAGRGTDIRLNEHVRAQGGLHVILSEFHESARVDRQLFGRCARQGEPGSAEAMVSLEDELFRRYVPILRKLTHWLVPSSLVPRTIARCLVTIAQRRAERRNLKIRLQTLKQDRKLQSTLAFSGTGH